MDYEQFYSTPPEVAIKLINMLKHADSYVLEPSAGSGSLIDVFKQKRHYYSGNIHCIEINEQRAAFLKDKGYSVIWNDFNTFQPIAPYYSTIIMNPPFHEGAKHLLKAINICNDGGEVACILNAETIKNPFSNERKQLIRTLEEQEDYKIEYISNAFTESEQPTDVEIALVYVRKKKVDYNCVILDKFKKAVFAENTQSAQQSVVAYGEIEQLIAYHDAEVLAALALYDEVENYNRVCLKNEHSYPNEIFEIKINTVGDKGDKPHAAIVRTINYKYWWKLFHTETISKIVTSKVRDDYQKHIRDMADFDFNERNILQLKEDLLRNLFVNIDAAIMKVFSQFTHDFSYEEQSKNIHYYSGWKTNKAFYCNKKVIIPLYAFDNWYKNEWSFETYKVRREIEDIERVFNHLDGGRTENLELYEQLEKAQKNNQFKNVDTKYFTIDFFKKGTAHLKFKDMELLKKFNIYAGRRKQWLPPSYGNKHYDAMDDEEKAVIDSFEGKEEYEKTFYNRDFYLNSADNMLMLNSGE